MMERMAPSGPGSQEPITPREPCPSAPSGNLKTEELGRSHLCGPSLQSLGSLGTLPSKAPAQVTHLPQV